ncbi:MAG: CBS domain-containing protein [Mariprofundaceae bacterium]|nr:CBS domain-containing protein [Mariprofundaceae bacterium]
MGHIVKPDIRLSDAFTIGNEHSHTVVDGSRVMGMLLMRDLLAKAADGIQPHDITVADVMHKMPITIQETHNKLAMARTFAQHRIKSLVVTDNAGHYVRDLDPPEAIASLPSGLMGFFQPAERCMIRNPYGIDADSSMDDVLQRMVKHKVSCLLVRSNNHATVGIISESDVTRWVIEGQTAQPVSACMSSPIASMPEQSNLMQVWREMNTMQVMKMALVDYNGAVSGLITATDVLCALCQSMMDNFSHYRCPKQADMMMEWHKGGMIMAVSDALLHKLGCERDELVGLEWGNGMDSDGRDSLLGMSAQAELPVLWQHHEQQDSISFVAKRDQEQPMMWWSLV